MDPISAIIAALAAGAAAALKDAASESVKNAYEALKNLLAGKLLSLTTLEGDPSDEDYRKAAAKELQKKGLAENPAVLEKAQALTRTIEQEAPEQLAAWGIDIERVHAASSVIIKSLEAQGGGVRVRDIEARDGNIQIEGIRAGGPGKN
jgi:hypothetical protein